MAAGVMGDLESNQKLRRVAVYGAAPSGPVHVMP